MALLWNLFRNTGYRTGLLKFWISWQIVSVAYWLTFIACESSAEEVLKKLVPMEIGTATKTNCL